jgi:hypothetical protein
MCHNAVKTESFFATIYRRSYPAATPQCLLALDAATSKRDRPIMATAGPIVSGVIHLNNRLKRPKQKVDY